MGAARRPGDRRRACETPVPPSPAVFASRVFVPLLPMIRFRPLSPRLQAAAVGALLTSLAPGLHAQTRTTTTTTRRTTTTRSLESTAQTEVARRQSMAVNADDSLRQGDAAMLREDYEDAVRLYRTATDSFTDSPATGDRRRVALQKFVKASLKLAELRIVEARYPDAEAVAKIILRPEYDPNNEEAVELLQHLEDPEYYNQTITPKHVQKVQRVKDLLRAGNQYYDTGRYDLSFKKFEEVLALDPYNDAARRGEERIDLAKSKHSENAGYPEARGRLLQQVNSGWELPVRRNTADIDPRRNVQKLNDSSGTVAITRKLQSIVIPNIEFRQTTLNDAVEFLRQEARRLDTGAPEEERGVNIFLKLTSGSPRSAAAAPVPSEASIPGLPTGADAAPAAAPSLPLAAAPTGTSRISLTLSRIPLLAALDYVAKAANLKIKVEPYAVSIVPLTEETGDLITLEVRVPPSFIGTTNTGAGPSNALNESATTAGQGGGGTVDRTGTGSGPLTTRQDAKTFLESNGVTFPPGASAVYLASTSKLVVRNTQANIDLVQTLVGEVVQVPKQVEIESKFIDINQTNLKELGFDWTLGQFNLGSSSEKVFAGGGTGGTGRTFGDSSNQFGFTGANGGVIGGSPVTAGNRTGTFGISANAVDALLLGTTGGMAAAPGIFSVAGVFTDPQFQVLIRALNQQKGVDLLSAPRVTAKSGQKATIEIIREFIYPTQFQPPQIPQTIGSTSGSTLGVNGGSAPSFPVTPTTPTAFEKRNTGVTLEVDPIIGPDNFTIDLTLQPQVVDFDGFINYGSPIQTVTQNALGISQTNVLTPNVINQPVFSVRKVSTSVSIYDGSTVVLGGLVREDIQKVNDKVPILGDVPLVGRLFRSKIDQNIKRNLIIFVTARLIDPAGQPLLTTAEEEEETSALTGPDTYVQPPGPLPNYYKK